jgi:hypothetical protein
MFEAKLAPRTVLERMATREIMQLAKNDVDSARKMLNRILTSGIIPRSYGSQLTNALLQFGRK